VSWPGIYIICPVVLQIYELHDTKSTTDEVIRAKENVVNFIDTLQKLEFPTSAIFSCADIESTGLEDRHAPCTLPQVPLTFQQT
jgi:hypothetical protein